MTDWEALLAAMEDGLDSFPPVVVGALPADPGPLPAALVGRAARALSRMGEAEAALERARADIARELAALSPAAAHAARTAAGPVPHFLDTRA